MKEKRKLNKSLGPFVLNELGKILVRENIMIEISCGWRVDFAVLHLRLITSGELPDCHAFSTRIIRAGTLTNWFWSDRVQVEVFDIGGSSDLSTVELGDPVFDYL